MIFMIMALVVLAAVLLWHVDLHNILQLKARAQNGGDAAALSAARWQGTTLNLIGDLNVLQAVALSGGDVDTAARIAELQARLCYVGPMIALLASQQAAKQNGLYVNEAFTQVLLTRANEVQTEYAEVFPEPYTNCWQEYGDMLLQAATEGLAAAPDNYSGYVDASGGHTLYNREFYLAVLARDWCWFKWNALDLLQDYTDYLYWPDLPAAVVETQPVNSEFFSLGLQPLTAPVPGGVSTIARLNTLRAERALSATTISNAVAQVTSVWYVYNTSRWTAWSAISRSGDNPFPVVADVRSQYDYAGADAVVRIETTPDLWTTGVAANAMTWTAAAKPLGYLTTDGAAARPDAYSLVLPAYRQVRLIPVDAASGGQSGFFDLTWQEHITAHVPEYMDGGPAAIADTSAACSYCAALVAWEDEAFRQSGLDWLTATNPDTGELLNPCLTGGGGGGSPGGGTQRGH